MVAMGRRASWCGSSSNFINLTKTRFGNIQSGFFLPFGIILALSQPTADKIMSETWRNTVLKPLGKTKSIAFGLCLVFHHV